MDRSRLGCARITLGTRPWRNYYRTQARAPAVQINERFFIPLSETKAREHSEQALEGRSFIEGSDHSNSGAALSLNRQDVAKPEAIAQHALA